MARYQIDLHTHTTASDGTLTPTQLVQRAAQHSLTVVAITDHDTIDGLAEGLAAGERFGVEVVTGVEFSLRHEVDKQFVGLHLLGYFIDPAHPALVEVMGKVLDGRIDQKVRQIEKLQSFGFDVPVDEVLARVRGVPGRPHIAAVLLERNPHKFNSIQQIFDEYLGVQAKAHVGRSFSLTLAQATEVIKQAGGLPVFAHPGAYDADIDPVQAVRNAKAEGLEGLEVFYPYDDGRRSTIERGRWLGRAEALARELDLLPTGGTDFHGRPQNVIELGDMGLTEKQFVALKNGWRQRRACQI
jgi:hypothetical protein